MPSRLYRIDISRRLATSWDRRVEFPLTVLKSEAPPVHGPSRVTSTFTPFEWAADTTFGTCDNEYDGSPTTSVALLALVTFTASHIKCVSSFRLMFASLL